MDGLFKQDRSRARSVQNKKNDHKNDHKKTNPSKKLIFTGVFDE
jgi:hypothetical protein